jgi:hypothetical protein
LGTCAQVFGPQSARRGSATAMDPLSAKDAIQAWPRYQPFGPALPSPLPTATTCSSEPRTKAHSSREPSLTSPALGGLARCPPAIHATLMCCAFQKSDSTRGAGHGHCFPGRLEKCLSVQATMFLVSKPRGGPGDSTQILWYSNGMFSAKTDLSLPLPLPLSLSLSLSLSPSPSFSLSQYWGLNSEPTP